MVDTNLKGVFFCIQCCREAHDGAAVRQDREHIVHRRTGLDGRGGINLRRLQGGHHGSSPRAVPAPLGPFGINVQHRRPRQHRYAHPWRWAGRRAGAGENAIGKSAIGRLGYRGHRLNAVLFLASDYASFIDGQTIAVDGAGST